MKNNPNLLLLSLLLATVLSCGGGGGGGGGGDDDGGNGTPVPTRTPQPGSSVCGGSITSTPRLCNLTVSPSSVSRFGSVTLRFGVSDLEGDINLICTGIALVPFDPVIDCEFGSPRGSTINEFLTTAPISLGGVPPGTYIIGFNVGDQGGHTSNTLTATFQVR